MRHVTIVILFAMSTAGMTAQDDDKIGKLSAPAALQKALRMVAKQKVAAISEKSELAIGQLVRPFDQAIEAEAQFYFVCLPERLDEPDIRAFHDWIVSGFTGAAVYALP